MWCLSGARRGQTMWRCAFSSRADGAASRLHLPAPIDDQGTFDPRSGAGVTLNRLHAQFSQVLGRDTQAELRDAQKRGAVIRTHHGFVERNLHVARSSYLIAFTTGTGWWPRDREARP